MITLFGETDRPNGISERVTFGRRRCIQVGMVVGEVHGTTRMIEWMPVRGELEDQCPSNRSSESRWPPILPTPSSVSLGSHASSPPPQKASTRLVCQILTQPHQTYL